LRPLNGRRLITKTPLLKHSIFNRHGQKLCRFFMPFSFSDAFGKESPDFQTVNLAQKKRCVQMNRAQRFKD
jgi:hypothetical protein